MSFLAPIFLAGTAAAAVPILLHLLKRHADQRVRFSAVRLLKMAPVEDSAQRRLRQLLLLALRVAVLVLLSFAFARPFFRAASATSPRVTVVAIDTSLSMSTPARLKEAQRLASDAIQRAAPGEVAVLAFSDRATVAVEPTTFRSTALAAVKAIAAGYGSTNYRAALAAAGALFRGHVGTLVLVTDLQANGWNGDETGAVPEGI